MNNNEIKRLDRYSIAKPSFILSVGITGHRNIQVEDFSRFEESVIKILEFMKQTFINNIGKGDIRNISFRLVSPLAEGADRIAAYAALKCGYELYCPLPFKKEEYEKDFLTVESKNELRELLRKANSVFEIEPNDHEFNRDEAYLNVGQYILNQCNILISIWDGDETYRKGGTHDITRRAIDKNIPVLWINSSNCITKLFLGNYNFSNWEEELRKRMLLISQNKSRKNIKK